MKRKLISIALAVFLLLTLSIPAFAMPESAGEQLALLEEIKTLLDDNHLYPNGDGPEINVTAEQLTANPKLFLETVKKWLANDKYGYFMDQEQYNAAYNPEGSSGYGIGVQIDTAKKKGTYITGFLYGSDAEKKGMVVGSQIVSVDGVNTVDLNYSETRSLLLGSIFFSVNVGYILPGSTKTRYAEVDRMSLEVPHVNAEILEDGIGYISISQFGSIMDYYRFYDFYHGFFPENNVKSVIIDLRGNPGGQNYTVLNILNCLIKDDGELLMRLVTNNPDTEEQYYSTGYEVFDPFFEPENIVILVNGGSYSASEVMAGTLQGYGNAEVVGVATGGKSHSQYHIPLSTGDYLIFTYSRIELYNTPAYDGIGITPEHLVENKYQTGSQLGFAVLDSSRAIFRFASGERVYALEEHLAALGYFYAEPDGVFDDYTLWCANRFAACFDLPQAKYVSAAVLEKLTGEFENVRFYEDTQLDYAIGLCK